MSIASLFSGIKNLLKKESAGTETPVNNENVWIPISGTVTRERYTGMVFSCVDKNAEAVAKTKFYLEREVGPGEFERVDKHPLLDVIRDPHPSLTWLELKRMFGGFMQIDGEFYFVIQKTRSGQPYALYPVNPKFVSIETNLKNQTVVGYSIAGVRYATDDVIPFHNFNPYDVNRGIGRIQAAIANLDNISKARLWNSSIYDNSACPGGVLSYPQGVEIDQQTLDDIRNYFNKRNAGTQNVGKVVVTTGGASYHQLSITPKELDYLESVKADEKFIQRNIFSVPDIVFGDAQTGNYANGVTAINAWQEYTVDPMARIFADQITEWLIPQFPGSEKIRMTYESVVTENRELLKNEVTGLYDSGIITLNEARAKYSLQPLLDGDVIKPVNTSLSINHESAKSETSKTLSVKNKADSKQYNHELMAKASDGMYKSTEEQFTDSVKQAYLDAGKLAASQWQKTKSLDSTNAKDYQHIFANAVIPVILLSLSIGGEVEEKYLGVTNKFSMSDPVIITSVAAIVAATSASAAKTFRSEIDATLANDLVDPIDAITAKTNEISSWMTKRLINSTAGTGFILGRSRVRDLSGQKLAKAWRTSVASPNPCPLCIENENYGWIPASSHFPNESNWSDGIAHPHCYCYQIEEPAELHGLE